MRAEYLVQGYGNGAHLPDDAKALVGAIDDFEGDWRDVLAGPILWMNGTDHLVPQPDSAGWWPRPTTLQDDYELEVTSLARTPGRCERRPTAAVVAGRAALRARAPTCSWA